MDALVEQILLPLLGGFVFVVTYYRLRFLTLRTTGEKLVLIAGVAAILLAVIGKLVSFNIHMFLDAQGGPELVDYWRKFWRGVSPFPLSYVIAFAAGPALGLVLNRTIDRDQVYTWALELLNDNFELMLDRSLRERQPILISLRSNRVYVGIALSPASPRPNRTHFTVLPLWSGFRVPFDSEKDAGRIEFVNDYRAFMEVIDALMEANLGDAEQYSLQFSDGKRSVDFNPDHMGILISRDDVETMTLFDHEVYAFLNRDREPGVWEAVSDPIDLGEENGLGEDANSAAETQSLSPQSPHGEAGPA